MSGDWHKIHNNICYRRRTARRVVLVVILSPAAQLYEQVVQQIEVG